MNDFQKKIKEFCDERKWGQFHNPKDLLLGIVEEIGEIRNIVKWEQDRSRINEAMSKNKAEMKDNIGDIYWFLSILANECNVNIDEAISEVIEKNKKRFPLEETKARHTNIHLGGKDKDHN
jgi:NTP pyrophosphatase (non-canonical NTP hydrolase)